MERWKDEPEARPWHEIIPPRTPEALLEDYWWQLDLASEERRRQSELACRSSMSQWWAKSEEERERLLWIRLLPSAGHEVLRRWAKEFHARPAGQR
jgi:hypothetical protein